MNGDSCWMERSCQWVHSINDVGRQLTLMRSAADVLNEVQLDQQLSRNISYPVDQFSFIVKSQTNQGTQAWLKSWTLTRYTNFCCCTSFQAVKFTHNLHISSQLQQLQLIWSSSRQHPRPNPNSPNHSHLTAPRASSFLLSSLRLKHFPLALAVFLCKIRYQISILPLACSALISIS